MQLGSWGQQPPRPELTLPWLRCPPCLQRFLRQAPGANKTLARLTLHLGAMPLLGYSLAALSHLPIDFAAW